MLNLGCRGRVAEWSIAAVSKTVDPSRGPEVRILSLPPFLPSVPRAGVGIIPTLPNMAKKKPDKKTLAAFNAGREQAAAILAVRSKALTRRAKALRRHTKVLASQAKVVGVPKAAPA